MDHDEQTPLLSARKPQRTPLPWFQLSFVLLLQTAEPLTSFVIYPFAPELIRTIVAGGDEKKIGYYVGVLQSSFFLAEAMTILQWSRLSDRIGRKPVAIMCLLGLSSAMYGFGLSRTFGSLVLTRCLSGALNGNSGVLKSIIAEITDVTNISQAYAYAPLAWSIGGLVGPVIGGALARPADRFPGLFGQSRFLKEFPYFLPSAVPATFAALAALATFFILKETHHTATSIREILGLQRKREELSDDLHNNNEIIVAGGGYASVALVETAYRAINPVFLAMPTELGGLGLDPPAIGRILGLWGILNGIFQIFFFVRVHESLGAKNTFLFGLSSAIPLFALFPVISYLVKSQGVTLWVWVIVMLQSLFAVMMTFCYGAIAIYIAAASPNRASLGATNGLCQFLVSISRAIAPALTTTLFSLSLQHNYLDGNMVYYVLLGVVGLSLYVGTLLPPQIAL